MRGNESHPAGTAAVPDALATEADGAERPSPTCLYVIDRDLRIRPANRAERRLARRRCPALGEIFDE